MFKIHTSDGKTVRVDMSDKEAAEQWREKLTDPDFQSTITGITIIQKCNIKAKCNNCGRTTNLQCDHCGQVSEDSRCKAGVQYSLSRPSMFKEVAYDPQVLEPDDAMGLRGGERIVCLFDGIQLVLMAHANQPAIRISLNKIGKRRYNPTE